MELLMPLYYTLVNRMCGSPCKWGGLPLYAVPYILLMDNVYKAIAVLAWVILLRVSGHADGFKNYVRDNSLSKIVIPLSELFGVKRNSEVYDAMFWFIKGGLIALLPAILTGNYMLLLSAIAFPFGYWLGFKINTFYIAKLEWCELITGFFVGLTFIGSGL